MAKIAAYASGRSAGDTSDINDALGGRIFINDNIYPDTLTHKLVKYEEETDLKVREYNMLLYILKNRGRVVTKDELLKYAWEDEYVGEGTLLVPDKIHLGKDNENEQKSFYISGSGLYERSSAVILCREDRCIPRI